MSEAELHVLRARLLGGQLNKARRGELWMRPPIGLVYDRRRRLVLDPDAQIQGTVRSLFETFRRTGSAEQVVRHFAREGLLWPRRLYTGAAGRGAGLRPAGAQSRPGHPPQSPLCRSLRVRPPRQRKVAVAGPARYRRLPRAEWKVFLPNAHPGTSLGGVRDQSGDAPGQCQWLRARSPAESGARRRRPAAGAGALRPLRRPDDRTLCRPRTATPRPTTLCQRRGIATGAAARVRSIPGAGLDDAVAQVMLDAVTPGRARRGARGLR